MPRALPPDDGRIFRNFSFAQAEFLTQQAGSFTLTPAKEQFRFFGLPGFSGTSTQPGTIDFVFTLYAEDALATFAGETFPIAPWTVKWRLGISNWGMALGHQLELDISINSSSPIVAILLEEYDPVNKTVRIMLQTTETVIVMEFPTVVEADGLAVPMDSIPTLVNATRLTIPFPYFNQGLLYDPDVSILVPSAEGGDDSPDTVLLESILPGVLVPLSVLFISGRCSSGGDELLGKAKEKNSPRDRADSFGRQWSTFDAHRRLKVVHVY